MDLFSALLAKSLSKGGGGDTYDIYGDISVSNGNANNYTFNAIIQEGTTSTDANLFSNAKVASVKFPNSIETIGINSFSGTLLSEVDLPSGIKTIGKGAFRYCSLLKSIICRAGDPPTLGDNAFGSVPNDCNIYVPSESVNAYKAADGWSARAAYIQAIPE